MQKLKYAVPMVLLFGVSAVNAGGFGHRSEAAPVSSAQSVSSAPDGAPVTVRGEIAARRSADQYVLSDNTGSIAVSLNDSSGHRPLATGTPVEVSGQVAQSSYGQPRIEAQSVTVLAWSSAPSTPDINPPISGRPDYQHFES